MRVVISLTGLCLTAVCLSISIGPSTAYRRVCYLTNWSQYRQGPAKFFPENMDASLCTHVIFAFGKVVGNAIQPFEWNDHSTAWMTGMYERLNNMKGLHPHLKTLLAIGGWTHGSRPFTAMASTAASRREFAQSSIEYLRRWNFDGLDVDWEYPANTAVDTSPPEDRERFVLLLQDLRRAYEDEAVSSGKARLLLGIAGNAGKDKLDRGYDIARIVMEVDFISIMSYDYHGTWERVTGLNAPLTGRAGESAGNEYYNLEFTADYYVRLGAPREKLNIGLAMYGHSFTLANANEHGVGAPVRGGGQAGRYTRESGFLAYYEICELLHQGATRYWHDEHQAPYAVLGNQWVGYDDLQSLQLKIDYIKRSNYGGIMVWSLDLDDFQNVCGEGPYPLMKAINRMLIGTNPPASTTTMSASSAHTDPTTKNSVPYTLGPNTLTPRTSQTTASSPVTTDSHVDFTCGGLKDGFYPNPTSCEQYFWCASRRLFRQTCASGTLFDARRSRCSHAHRVTCSDDGQNPNWTTEPTTASTTMTTAPMTDCQGRRNGFYHDPNSCSDYYICAAGLKFELRCIEGLLYDTRLNRCSYAYQVDCGSRAMPTTSTTTTTTTRAQTTSPRTTAPAVMAPFIAPIGNFCDNRPNGLYRMPNNCGSFYQCAERMTFRQRCPPGLAFDENLHLCNYRYTIPGC